MKRFYYETAILRSGRCRRNMEVGEFSKGYTNTFIKGKQSSVANTSKAPTHAVFIHSHTGGVIGIPKCSASFAYHGAFVSSWIFTPSLCQCMYMCMCMCLCLCVFVFE